MLGKKWMASGVMSAALLAGMTGCGGSVSEVAAPEAEDVTVPEVEDVAVVELPQGIWRGPMGSDNVSVIVLPTATSTAGALWAISRDSFGTTRLFKADVTSSGPNFVGTGSVLTSNPTSVGPAVEVSVAGSASPQSSLSFALGSDSASLAAASYYADSASLADWTGQWQNSQALGSAGTLVTNWTVSAEGVISGTRSDGCSYAGTVALRPEAKAVVNITVAETCASTTLNFSGIGSPGVSNEGDVIGRIATLLRADGQSFSLLLFTEQLP